MKKILSTLSTFLFVSSIATSVFAAGDEATIKNYKEINLLYFYNFLF